jgi:predicted nucleotidyltransferase
MDHGWVRFSNEDNLILIYDNLIMDRNLKTITAIQPFLDLVVLWAGQNLDIQAVALVGSYSRGKATESSDIDLVLLVDKPEKYLGNTGWVSQFGVQVRQLVEEYGKLTSLRVWYQEGQEVEFGLTTTDWVACPLDNGTDQVLMDRPFRAETFVKSSFGRLFTGRKAV